VAVKANHHIKYRKVGSMPKDTDAFRLVKFGVYGASLVLALILGFLSTSTPLDPRVQKLSEDFAIAIVISITGSVLLSFLRHLFDKHADETNTALQVINLWKKFGINEMAANWKDLMAPSGVGRGLLNELERFHKKKNWYIVTISPQGFMGQFFDETILPAIQRGVRIKWAYVHLPDKEEGDRGKTLCDWWDSQYSLASLSERNENLEFAKKNLANNLSEIKRRILEEVAKGTASPKSIELYESQIPTTYLGLLAIKKPRGELVPTGKRLGEETLGIRLVYPYVIFPMPDSVARWGMVLVSPGELYKEYAASTLRFFNEGQTRKYLRRVWPES
jgi:hypothetical protein